MSLYDDLVLGLSTPEVGGTVRSSEAELVALRREVSALRRVVARLAEIVASDDRVEPVLVKSLLAGELDLPLPLEETAAPPPDDAPTFAESPYRGAVPDRDGELRCHRCRRKLEADDPEMSLEEGRVCVACFQLADG